MLLDFYGSMLRKIMNKTKGSRYYTRAFLYGEKVNMIGEFFVNRHLWRVKYVHPNSKCLIDRTGKLRVATTDPSVNTIFLSTSLNEDFLKRVIIHEMTHVVLWEYNIISHIKKYCKPQYRIDMEEEICNILAEYGEMVFRIAYSVIGGEAIFIVPYEMERLVA